MFVFTGSSQNPLCANTESNGVVTSATGGIVVADPNLSADPVCIRCGRGLTIFTDTDEVTYTLVVDDSPLVNNTNGVSITDEGLILSDPVESFADGTELRCSFNGVFNVFSIVYLGKGAEITHCLVIIACHTCMYRITHSCSLLYCSLHSFQRSFYNSH